MPSVVPAPPPEDWEDPHSDDAEEEAERFVEEAVAAMDEYDESLREEVARAKAEKKRLLSTSFARLAKITGELLRFTCLGEGGEKMSFDLEDDTWAVYLTESRERDGSAFCDRLTVERSNWPPGEIRPVYNDIPGVRATVLFGPRAQNGDGLVLPLCFAPSTLKFSIEVGLVANEVCLISVYPVEDGPLP